MARFWKNCRGIGALIRLRIPWTREEPGAGIPFFSFWWHAPLTGFYAGEHWATSVPGVVRRGSVGIPEAGAGRESKFRWGVPDLWMKNERDCRSSSTPAFFNK